MILKNRKGLLSLPLCLGLLTLVLAGVGIERFLSEWNKISALQLKLDRCVGEITHDLRDLTNQVETANTQMLALRASLSAGMLAPPAAAAISAALDAIAIAQVVRQTEWEIKEARWAIQGGCDHLASFPSFLPDFPWTTDPPDALGPQPLRWSAEEDELKVSLTHSPRFAAALIEKKGDTDVEGNQWTTEWTSLY